MDATSLGNAADADVKQWPRSARRVKQRYGDAAIVVPGHGEPGNADPFQHTLDLFNTRRATDE